MKNIGTLFIHFGTLDVEVTGAGAGVGTSAIIPRWLETGWENRWYGAIEDVASVNMVLNSFSLHPEWGVLSVQIRTQACPANCEKAQASEEPRPCGKPESGY